MGQQSKDGSKDRKEKDTKDSERGVVPSQNARLQGATGVAGTGRHFILGTQRPPVLPRWQREL